MSDARTYEMMVILPATLAEASAESVMGRLTDEITRAGGAVRESTPMGQRTFARPLHKQHAGHYVSLIVTLPPDRVAELTARLKLVDDLFRVQILATDEKQLARRAEKAARGDRDADDNGKD